MSDKMKNPRVLVTAPGKVILFGEHSVVYGRKALAASVEKRMKLKLFNHNTVQLDLLDLNCSRQWDVEEINTLIQFCKAYEDESRLSKLNEKLLATLKNFLKVTSADCSQVEKALLSFLYLLVVIYHNKHVQGMRIEVQSSIPVGSGLGSSAAFLACLSGTLLANSGDVTCFAHGDGPCALTEEDLRLINSHAFLAEHIFHGRPSGLDNMISVYGSAMIYSGRGSFQLCGNLPEMNVVIVDTNVTRSTKNLVEKVRLKLEKYPSVVNNVFDAVHHITEKGEEALKDLAGRASVDEGSRAVLNELVDMNQMLLNSLGVGHSRIDEAIGLLGKFSIHSKLTGAGGGGSVVGLMPPDISRESLTRMMEACQSLGFSCHVTTLGTRGLTISMNLF